MDKSPSRRLLCRWIGWFFFATLIVMLAIGTGYISLLPDFGTFPLATTHAIVTAWVFTTLAFIGQFALFAGAAALICCIMALIAPYRSLIFTVAIFFATILGFYIILDCTIYHHFRFHLNSLVIHIVMSGEASQVLVLSTTEWLTVIALVIGLVLVYAFIARWLWRRLQKHADSGKKSTWGRMIALILAVCLFISYVMFLLATYSTSQTSVAALSHDHMIILASQDIPQYQNILGLLIPQRKGGQVLATINDGYFKENKQVNLPLRYPLRPLLCRKQHKPYNIVFLVIDTWRADTMNAVNSPHIAAFAKQATTYTNHWSGGNCTRPGIFSMFYSIPPTYWTAVKAQHKSPLMINLMLKDHYQFCVHGSASLHYPAFDKTVFQRVPNLQVNTPGANSIVRDKKITEYFKQFLNKRDKKRPFFTFLFYDEVHEWCGTKQTFKQPFQPAVKDCDRFILGNDTNPLPYFNRYKNAVLFDDGQVGQDIAALRAHGLLKNTIVVVTADHGEEFNDEHLGYWGHASAYDPYQVTTPFIVYWPGKKPATIPYKTSHYDLVPTLLHQAMGCSAPISQYSVGVPLAVQGHRPFLIVGSYIDYAILQKNRITTIFPDGNYAVSYANQHPIPGARLDVPLFQKAMVLMRRYFKK